MFWGLQMGKGTPMKLKHSIAPYVYARYVPYIPELRKPFRGPENSNTCFRLTIQHFDFILFYTDVSHLQTSPTLGLVYVFQAAVGAARSD